MILYSLMEVTQTRNNFFHWHSLGIAGTITDVLENSYIFVVSIETMRREHSARRVSSKLYYKGHGLELKKKSIRYYCYYM